MKQKNLFYLFTCCALSFLAFTACSDDDKTDVPPTAAVINLTFTDTDTNTGKIGGTLAWELPTPEGDITGYNIYFGSTATQKDKMLGVAQKGTTSFAIPADTDYASYIIVVAINTFGESNNLAAVAVTDVTPNNPDPEVPPTTTGIYILNSGNYNENNATLSFYNITTGTITSNLYQTANGSGLGDSAEQILLYGSKIYITVPTSNRLVVLDSNHKLLKSIEPKDGANPLNPRGMVAHEGKVYVSYFYGHQAAMLDTTSLTIEKTVEVGRYPEQLTVSNGKLYVANSGGLDFPDYGKTVSVVNLSSFQVEKDIQVALNPVSLAADSEGDVYVISMGDYGDVKNTLQRIDGQTGEVAVIDNASRMSLVNNKLYYMYAQWGNPDTKFKVYDVLAEKIVNDKFIANDIQIDTPEALAVDPITEKIYITSAPYGATSDLYIFSADGKLEGGSIDTKGYYAKSIAFLSK